MTQEKGEGITLTQLLASVEQALNRDAKLGERLFMVMLQLSRDTNQPQELRALARVLRKILAGEDEPKMDALSSELAIAVKEMLERLKK